MAKKHVPKLKIEFISETSNLHYLAIIEHKREQYLCIINNITEDEIGAYVLDYIEQEKLSLPNFLSLVNTWFYSSSCDKPLSIEIAKMGLTRAFSPIFRTFDKSYVSRIIGNAFSYKEANSSKVKRRRVIPLPEGIEITFKKN